MEKTLSLENTAQFLNEQQETVGIIDEYIQPILLKPNSLANHNHYPDFVMQHIFVNIRNSYQDGVLPTVF